MLTKQIAIFVENRTGRVFEVSKILSDAKINLYGITIADTAEFGVMRCLSEEPERAVEILSQHGILAKIQEAIVVSVPDDPGGLAAVLQIFAAEGISVEYLYSFVHTQHGACNILFKVSEPMRAAEVCKNNGIEIVCGNELYARLPEE